MTELDLDHALHVVERAVQQAKVAQDQSAAEAARQQARAEHLQTRLTLEHERVKELEKQLAAVSRPPTPHNRSALGIHMGRSRGPSKMNRRHTTPPGSLPCASSDAVVASLLHNAHLQERLSQQCEELEKLRTALAELQEEQRTKLSATSTDGDPMSPSSQRRSTLPLSRLWDMLDRAVNLQRATLNEVAEAADDGAGYQHNALQEEGQSPTSSYDDTEGEEEQEVSLADDGSAGVGATAAAAVSVALAQSWAATARHTALHGDATTFGWSSQGGQWNTNGLPKGDNDNTGRSTVAMDTTNVAPTAHDLPPRPDNGYSASSLPKSPNNATRRRRPVLVRRDPRSETSRRMGYGRARFKLVAAVPRARRTKEAGAPVPLSALPARLTLLPTESHVALDSLADAERSAMDENQEAEWRACGSHLKLQWLSPPRSALVACKPSEVESPHTVRAVLWLLSRGMTVWVEPSEHGRMLEAVIRVLKRDADGMSGHDANKQEDDGNDDDDVFKQLNRSLLGSNPSSLRTSNIISASSLQQFVSDDSSSSVSSSSANLLQSATMDEISRAASPACGLSSSRRLPSSQRSGTALAGRPPSAPGGGARMVDPGDIDLDVQLRTWLPQQPWEQRGPCVALAAKAAAEDPERRRNEDEAGMLGDKGASIPNSPQEQVSCTSLSSEPDGPTPLPTAVAAAIDVVVSLGGDGTLLWACGLFGDAAVPPIVSFAMGSLGFMTPFPAARIATVLSRVTSTAHGFPLMLRHRLQGVILRGSCLRKGAATPCQSPPLMVLNELVIDRGTTPFLTNLHVYADGAFVTVVQGDGLILATPTGSTAYSLAAGGSMVHPGVPCLLFTPICAHTLSSRPLVFPEHVTLTIMVPSDARAGAYISFDGKHRARLAPGDGVAVRASQWPVPTVCNLDASNDWFRSVRDGLNWNTRVIQGHAET